MSNRLEYISIFDIVSDLKREFNFSTREETEQEVFNALKDGIIFNNKHFSISYQDYNNFITGPAKQYYIECTCSRSIRKLYIKHKEDGSIQYGCRRCLSIRTSPRASDRLLRLQHHVTKLLTCPNKKQQERAKEAVIKHINGTLNDKALQSAYYSLLIKEFQKTILNEFTDRGTSKATKAFCKKLMGQLRDIKSIIFFNNK